MAPHPLKAERVHAERMRHLVFRDDLVPCTIPHNRGPAAEVHLSRSQPNHASAMPVVFTARNLFGSTRHVRRLMPNQLHKSSKCSGHKKGVLEDQSSCCIRVQEGKMRRAGHGTMGVRQPIRLLPCHGTHLGPGRKIELVTDL